MVRSLALRFFPLSVTAFALAAVVGLAVSEFRDAAAFTKFVEAFPAPAPAYTGDLPDVALETSSGAHTSFAATNGHVRITTLFYSHCPGLCPLTLETLRGIEGRLTQQQLSKLNFVLVSLDPARDAPDRMRAMAAAHGIESSRWLMGRASAAGLANLAEGLHIRYRTLSDGSIDHSMSLVLLDEQGRILSSTGDGEVTPEFVAAVTRALDAAGSR